MREKSISYKIPPRPIREIAADGVAATDEAIEKLTAWGVRIPATSRLHQAKALLADALTRPNVPLDVLGAGKGLHALEVAYDYRDIGSALPASRVASVRKELERSLNAPLDPDPADRQPLQLQSQFLVLAALNRAGVELEYPTHSPQKGRKSPEVIVVNGIAKYSVEVKRPQSVKGVRGRVEYAAAQISDYGLEGAVLVDLTDAVRSVPANSFDEVTRAQALRIYDQIWVPGEGPRPGYAPVMVGGGFARRAWYVDTGPPPLVKIQSHSSMARFAMTPNTRRDHHAGWLREKFHQGLAALGFAGEG